MSRTVPFDRINVGLFAIITEALLIVLPSVVVFCVVGILVFGFAILGVVSVLGPL